MQMAPPGMLLDISGLTGWNASSTPALSSSLRAPDLNTGNGFKIAVAGFFDTDHLTAMAVAANHPGVRS